MSRGSFVMLMSCLILSALSCGDAVQRKGTISIPRRHSICNMKRQMSVNIKIEYRLIDQP